MNRHLLDIASLEDAAIEHLLARAQAIAEGAPARLEQAVIANLFHEPSTRTRVAFERAAQRLGASVVNLVGDSTSASKGENLIDTARTLHALGVNVIVLRHPENGSPMRLADALPEGMHLVNAGDGTRAHPTQALLDACTLRGVGKRPGHCRIAIIGDLGHSRVARSALTLFQRLGYDDLVVAGPPAWLPADHEFPGVARCQRIEDAIAGADVIMMLRIQHERMTPMVSGMADREDYHARWGLTAQRLRLAAPDCCVMHPGPLNRGVEITSAVADGAQSLIWQQVANGLPTRMAVFEWLFDA